MFSYVPSKVQVGIIYKKLLFVLAWPVQLLPCTLAAHLQGLAGGMPLHHDWLAANKHWRQRVMAQVLRSLARPQCRKPAGKSDPFGK